MFAAACKKENPHTLGHVTLQVRGLHKLPPPHPTLRTQEVYEGLQEKQQAGDCIAFLWSLPPVALLACALATQPP